MHKLGYSYLPKGRQIALQISESTNKHRYTTNLNQQAKLPSPESINEILSLPKARARAPTFRGGGRNCTF
jgi:hypothetical protein